MDTRSTTPSAPFRNGPFFLMAQPPLLTRRGKDASPRREAVVSRLVCMFRAETRAQPAFGGLQALRGVVLGYSPP